MKNLSKNWITEDLIDAEYKRYILLAYLSEVGQNFDEKKLYPHLAEVIEHHRQLVALKQNTQNLYSSFPDYIKQVDWENLRLDFEKMVQNDGLMSELEEIINYSIPQFEKYVQTGKQIFDYVENLLQVEPVGVLPLYAFEGYMFLLRPKSKETYVYEYSITIFEEAEQRYRAIHTEYIDSYKYSFSNTPENIKLDLIKNRGKLPNPAVYMVNPQIEIPLMETYLPIAKRAVVKLIRQ